MFNDIGVPIAFPGKLTLDGDWNDFSGPVLFGRSTEVEGRVAETEGAVWLAADSQGSWQGVHFDNLEGRYLNGSLAGNLDLAWIDSYRMHGQLTVVGLDPGALVEDLEGRTSIEITAELLVPYDDQPLQASLEGTIQEGHLRGHAIAGQLAADWQNESLYELDLDLSSEGSRVVARGRPAERLDLDLTVTDLQSFHPDLAGQLLASGWLRWSDEYLTGEVDGLGEDLVWQETSLAGLHFHGSHLAQKTPLELEIDGQDLQHAGLQIDHLLVGLNGTLESHNVQMTVHDLAGDLDAKLTGQYRDDGWQAELQTFSGQTSIIGEWALEETARITWQPGTLTIENFSLASHQGERVTLEISEWGASATSQVALTWHDLNHDWLAYLQPSQALSGRSTGELLLEMVDQRPVSLEAKLTASAELQEDLAEIIIPSLTAEATWLEDGLELDLSAASDTGERFAVSAHSSQPLSWQWPPDELSLDMQWQRVSLERLSRFQDKLDVQGLSEGTVQLEILKGQLQRVNARITADAKITADGFIQQESQPGGSHSLLADLQWDEQQFLCAAQIQGASGGLLALHLASTVDPRFSWPGFGQIELEIDDLDLQSLDPLLSAAVELTGVIRGKSDGYWQEDGQIFLEGQAGVSDSELIWHSEEGLVDATLRQVDVDWQWQGDHLKGSMVVELAKEGALRGSWQLPLPARWPVGFVTDGALQAELQGQLHVTGLLAALAPGQIQDLQGQVESDLQLTGTWQDPVFSGRMALTEAGAYLPSTGITIEDLTLLVSLQGEQLRIDEFSLQSGPGELTGSGMLNLDRWQLKDYHLEFKGERLQVYNFPELQVLCNPELTLKGDSESVQLHGSLLIPEMSLRGSATAPEALPSNDVVVVEEAHDDRKTFSTDADIRIDIELGDQVRVKTAGVDTRLEGGGVITLDEKHQLAVQGEIRLVEGVYKAYGANLKIKQGVLSYTGGPITNPGLRIFAAREVGTVLAGVQITGNAEAPVVTLYSRPAMPERDVLGYIFMGRPMRVGQEGEDALLIGTGALMPRYGETFSDIGISEVDIQGLFSGEGGVRLRKRLTEKWELTSTLGPESGVDLYYIFKFD
jgi:translocation and assembly module TamB